MKMKNACALIMAAAMVVSGGSPMLLFAETSQSADTSLSDQSAVKAAWDPLPRTVNLVQEDGYIYVYLFGCSHIIDYELGGKWRRKLAVFWKLLLQ